MHQTKKVITHILLVFYIWISSISASSQTVEKFVLSGEIFDDNNQALIHAHVTTSFAGISTVTSENGEFLLHLPKEFPIDIRISLVGMQSKTVVLREVPSSKLQITLITDQRHIEQVTVTGSRITNHHSQRIDPIHIRALPSAAGPGIEGLVRSQMGVASNNELSSQYRVRGGNFDENLVYVNGQEVYRPFLMHSGQQEGLSFVNPDMVESVEFSAGGFSSKYGDKMSSVLDITYKKPSEHGGSFSGSLLGANGHIEGATSNKKLSWITGARYKTNRYLLGTLDEKGDYNPNFTDIQSYLSYQITPRLSIDLLGYYSQNSYQFAPQSRETIFGTITDVRRFTIYFEGQEKDLFQTGYASLSSTYKVTDKQEYVFTVTGFRTFEEETFDIAGAYWLHHAGDQSSKEEDENLEIGIGNYIQHARNDLFGRVFSANIEGKHQSHISLTHWGAQLRREDFTDRIWEWEMIDSAGFSVPYYGDRLELSYLKKGNHDISNQRISAFVKNQFSVPIREGFLMVDAGIRGSYFTFNDELTVSPRILLSYLPSDGKNQRYRLSGGYYYQPPFFKEMRKPDGTLNEAVKAQKSIHIVSGYDYYFNTLNRPFKFTTELYYKWMRNLVPYSIDNVRIVYSGENEAKGYAAGIDFKLHGEMVPGEESWVTLSFLKTAEDLKNDQWLTPEKEGEPGYIPRPSDQRLNFSLFLQDHLPRNPNFKVHLSFLYGTGLPFGPPRSPRYLDTNRMPSYRRVDLGLSVDLLHSTKNGKRDFLYLNNLWLGLEVFNLLNISNTISYYWITDTSNAQYAIPNYLTSRRLNLKLTGRF